MQFKKCKLVCFGGGTGLPSLLSGLKNNPWLEVTAIVNMFDNGGSSGELRDRFGILPPGDILKCLLALSEDELAARKILLKRIERSDDSNHTAGNLLLLALEKVYADYPAAIDALGQILSVKGRVIPVTLRQSALCCKYTDGSQAIGEVNVDAGIRDGHDVQSLFLEPSVPASPEALAAIREADAFCIGPGSFFTSVLPNFLPQGIREAMAQTSAPVIFICNLFTEGRGMSGYTVQKLTELVQAAIGRQVTTIIANHRIPTNASLEVYAMEHKEPILPNEAAVFDPSIVISDLWLDAAIARHDASRLASLIFAAIHKA